MLSSQDQQVWDDVQRFWAMEGKDPDRLAPSASSWIWRDEEELPLPVTAGVWLTIALVLFGAVLAGLAAAVITAAGWALWHHRRSPKGQVSRRAADRRGRIGLPGDGVSEENDGSPGRERAVATSACAVG
jgi:hypothetical protein